MVLHLLPGDARCTQLPHAFPEARRQMHFLPSGHCPVSCLIGCYDIWPKPASPSQQTGTQMQCVHRLYAASVSPYWQQLLLAYHGHVV